ncbi:MAG TPA: type II secretion system protein GspG [Verrucomicrobiae bacterium]|nr:type II secretion system protein GspG [Verrucomicrobiae bacterium]
MAEAPPTVSADAEDKKENRPVAQKYFLLRFLIASGVWLVVSGISLYVAWQQSNHSIAYWQQWETRRALKDMSNAIAAYQQKFKVAPRTFEQIQAMTNDVPEIGYWSEFGFTDGWQHPFIITNEGATCLVISYGRDGKPGGKGIDYDLTSENRNPKESVPTFDQFFYNREMQGMVDSSCVCGGLAALLSFLTVRVPNLTRRGLIVIAKSLCVTLVGTLFVTIMITAVHIPSGH